MTLHAPVLLNEVLETLSLKADGIYIDGTFGRGGHTQAILKQLGPSGRLLAVDKDPHAIVYAKSSELNHDPRFSIEQGSFTNIYQYVLNRGWLGKVDGILLDLGVSSPQLDEASRGFSFMKDGPLDMRMDNATDYSAKEWIANATEKEIVHVLKTYGEERYAKRIANHIVLARTESRIKTTLQLADIVSKAHPKWEKHKHPATRTFQAIRIFINKELEDLERVLPQSLDILKTGGRLLVISFHSLEDELVKTFIKTYGSTADIPREIPLTQKELESSLRLKKIKGAIRASPVEIDLNPRARSAILRISEKLK